MVNFIRKFSSRRRHLIGGPANEMTTKFDHAYTIWISITIVITITTL